MKARDSTYQSVLSSLFPLVSNHSLTHILSTLWEPVLIGTNMRPVHIPVTVARGESGGRANTRSPRKRYNPLINSVEWAFIHCEALCLLCADSVLIYPFTCHYSSRHSNYLLEPLYLFLLNSCLYLGQASLRKPVTGFGYEWNPNEIYLLVH